MTLPTNEDGLYAWIIVLMLAYIGACYIVRFYRVLRSARAVSPTAQFFMAKMFDAGTFAVSVMLLIGIFDPPLLTLSWKYKAISGDRRACWDGIHNPLASRKLKPSPDLSAAKIPHYPAPGCVDTPRHGV